MNNIRKIVLPVLNRLKTICRKIGLKRNDEAVFSHIYHHREWGKGESVSGYGSELEATVSIRKKLPVFFRDYNINSLVDVPCGDLLWAKHITESLGRYIGIDVVPEIIELNRQNFTDPRYSFRLGDVTKDQMPKSDAILVRDLFIHLPEDYIKRAIKNIICTEFNYYIFSNYPLIDYYKEIDLGGCRSVNLLIPPFNLPEPEMIIEEDWTEKNLSVWRKEQLVEHLSRTSRV